LNNSQVVMDDWILNINDTLLNYRKPWKFPQKILIILLSLDDFVDTFEIRILIIWH
jgi:hypothetical protein